MKKKSTCLLDRNVDYQFRFADLFIVFAKIEDDEKLSAFIVEKDFGGITLEKKKNLVLKVHQPDKFF